MIDDDLDYDDLDPGIREFVRYLRRTHHLRTTDSGDGVTKFAEGRADESTLRVSHVFVDCGDGWIGLVAGYESATMLHTLFAERLEELGEEGYPKRSIEFSYDPVSRKTLLACYGFTGEDVSHA